MRRSAFPKADSVFCSTGIVRTTIGQSSARGARGLQSASPQSEATPICRPWNMASWRWTAEIPPENSFPNRAPRYATAAACWRAARFPHFPQHLVPKRPRKQNWTPKFDGLRGRQIAEQNKRFLSIRLKISSFHDLGADFHLLGRTWVMTGRVLYFKWIRAFHGRGCEIAECQVKIDPAGPETTRSWAFKETKNTAVKGKRPQFRSSPVAIASGENRPWFL